MCSLHAPQDAKETKRSAQISRLFNQQPFQENRVVPRGLGRLSGGAGGRGGRISGAAADMMMLFWLALVLSSAMADRADVIGVQRSSTSPVGSSVARASFDGPAPCDGCALGGCACLALLQEVSEHLSQPRSL